jgi:hypothetical protein
MAISPFITRNQVVLAKAQSSAGTDAVPTLSNAVLMEPPTNDPQVQTATTNELVGGFDTSPPFYTGAWRQFSSTIHVKGSGTAGTAPDWDPLMQGCAMGLTTFASDVTGTAQTGAAQSITLAAGASSTDNFYRGQVIQITGGTGSSQSVTFRTIVSYNGTTKVATVWPAWNITYTDGTAGVVPDATTNYAVRKGNLYKPVNTGYPFVTIYRYLLNRLGGNVSLEKLLDWQGSCTISLARNDCTFQFSGQGGMLDDVDVSDPGTPTYLNSTYPPLINGLVALDNNLVKLNLSIDLGNNISTEEDVNAQNGYSQAVITQRSTRGTARMPRLLKSSIDINSSLRSQTGHVLTAVWGSVAGNRMSVMIPAAVFTGRTTTDVNGVQHDSLAYATQGANAGVFLYVW